MAEATGRSRRARGALEQQVLACLATADGALSASDVQSALGSDLAYTTVMTTLARLHEKHALTRVVDGRAYRYTLAGGATGALANVTAHQMLRLLDGSDRAEVLQRFVADLDPQDEEVLVRLLARHDTTSTGAPPKPGEQPGGQGQH